MTTDRTTTDALLAFLRDRLDEDRDTARDADVKQGDPSWERHGPIALSDPRAFRVRSALDARPIALVQDVSGDVDDPDRETAILDGAAVAEHIARHDPARVLADVEAKRRIVSRCDLILRGRAEGMFNEGQVTDAWDNLRALALPYAGHPDYDRAWAL